jgi:hypothetical protein
MEAKVPPGMMENEALKALAARLGCVLVADEGSRAASAVEAEPAPEYLERFCCCICWNNMHNPGSGSHQMEVTLAAHIDSYHAAGEPIVRFALYPDGSRELLETMTYAEGRKRLEPTSDDFPKTKRKRKKK